MQRQLGRRHPDEEDSGSDSGSDSGLGSDSKLVDVDPPRAMGKIGSC